MVFGQEPGVPLVDAIRGLRLQLMEAMDQGDGSKLRFVVAPIELTLQLSATNAGNAGVKWWVVEAGAKTDRAVTQTIKLVLDPKMMTAAEKPSDHPTLLEGDDT